MRNSRLCLYQVAMQGQECCHIFSSASLPVICLFTVRCSRSWRTVLRISCFCLFPFVLFLSPFTFNLLVSLVARSPSRQVSMVGSKNILPGKSNQYASDQRVICQPHPIRGREIVKRFSSDSQRLMAQG